MTFQKIPFTPATYNALEASFGKYIAEVNFVARTCGLQNWTLAPDRSGFLIAVPDEVAEVKPAVEPAAEAAAEPAAEAATGVTQ